MKKKPPVAIDRQPRVVSVLAVGHCKPLARFIGLSPVPRASPEAPSSVERLHKCIYNSRDCVTELDCTRFGRQH